MISVCIPTYNGEKFIKEQIQSILVQLEEHDEIIISDDASTDNTLLIIREFHDKRIRIIHHKKSPVSKDFRYMYTTENLENALLNARGDYIYLADQDDVWEPDKIIITQASLQNHLLICSDCKIIDENGALLHSSYFQWNNSGSGVMKNLLKSSYLGCCMAFKKELLSLILPISKFKVPHDIWIGLIAELHGSIYFDKHKLVSYRRHEHNLSPSGGTSTNSLFFKLKYRWILLWSLSNRIIKLKLNK